MYIQYEVVYVCTSDIIINSGSLFAINDSLCRVRCIIMHFLQYDTLFIPSIHGY